MRPLYAAVFAVALSGCSDQLTSPPSRSDAVSPLAAKSGTHAPVVHIIYLVPADGRVRRDYVQNLRDAAVNLQAWYSDALGIGETFTLANPTVEVYRTDRTAAEYTTTPAGDDQSLWYWFQRDGRWLRGNRRELQRSGRRLGLLHRCPAWLWAVGRRSRERRSSSGERSART